MVLQHGYNQAMHQPLPASVQCSAQPVVVLSVCDLQRRLGGWFMSKSILLIAQFQLSFANIEL